MSGNSTGELFKVMTFGESHGPAIGAVIDGVRPGIPLSVDDIQAELDRRRPGQSSVTTQRKESDRVEILSGVFEGKTTGTPIAILIRNADQKSGDYDALKDIFRPGHADLTFFKKFGIRDHRGGGRASGRETAARVAAGSIAKTALKEQGVQVTAYTKAIGGVSAETIDLTEIENNAVRCPDADAAKKMVAVIHEAKESGDSVGGIIEVLIKGCPAGLGDPVFDKLEALLAKAVMSIGAVKGVEFGSGFACATMKGSQHNDQMSADGAKTNNAGGILGGISNGEDIVLRIAVKPTSSIAKEQGTVTTDGKETTIAIEGRHDPCLAPRIVPIVEAMINIVILDRLLVQRAIAE